MKGSLVVAPPHQCGNEVQSYVLVIMNVKLECIFPF